MRGPMLAGIPYMYKQDQKKKWAYAKPQDRFIWEAHYKNISEFAIGGIQGLHFLDHLFLSTKSLNVPNYLSIKNFINYRCLPLTQIATNSDPT